MKRKERAITAEFTSSKVRQTASHIEMFSLIANDTSKIAVRVSPGFGGQMFAAAVPDLTSRVSEVISKRICLFLKDDGGDLAVNSEKDGVVEFTLLGHCSSCPARSQTLRFPVGPALQEEIPEIVDVTESK
jgi:Fe-S cluster biogenesis protein NfuA